MLLKSKCSKNDMSAKDQTKPYPFVNESYVTFKV